MEHRATTGHLSLHTTHAPLQYHNFTIPHLCNTTTLQYHIFTIPQLYNTIPLQYHNFTIQHHTCTLLHLYHTISKDTCTIPFHNIPGAPASLDPSNQAFACHSTSHLHLLRSLHNSQFNFSTQMSQSEIMHLPKFQISCGSFSTYAYNVGAGDC